MHPGNPAVQQLVSRGAQVTSEMEVFFEVCPCHLIAVTGSDGKTTTTTLISEGHKVIVFGRHLKMLCIVDECLQRRGIHPLHYNGSLNTQQREDALRAFTDESHNVILITVGAGGEGITITEADRIIIIDPNWNPTVDDQAIDRAWVIFTF